MYCLKIRRTNFYFYTDEKLQWAFALSFAPHESQESLSQDCSLLCAVRQVLKQGLMQEGENMNL
jgi:hypothetical protein